MASTRWLSGGALHRVPPWTLAVTAMVGIQVGSALSLPLLDAVGPAGTAWLRLTFGSVFFLLVARPAVRLLRRGDLPGLLGLGIATGVMTASFLAALERIPLGTTVAIEFLGPLTVAAWNSKSWKGAIWPAVALGGVVCLTEPWSVEFDLLGVSFALLAGVGWGSYIVLTQHVGDRFAGIQGLALSTPIAAATAAVVGIPQAWGQITPQILLMALGLALLIPVIPFALEMLALKRMNQHAFGTLMAVEPAIAAIVGLIILLQIPEVLDVVGVCAVVAAGIATQRMSGREETFVTDVAVEAKTDSREVT